MRVRRAVLDDGNGPFLAGMQECKHLVCGGSLGQLVVNEQTCPHCHGTGWVLVPIVIVDIDDEQKKHDDAAFITGNPNHAGRAEEMWRERGHEGSVWDYVPECTAFPPPITRPDLRGACM